MKKIWFGLGLLALLAGSVLLGQERSSVAPAPGPPLGSLVNGMDFSGSWQPGRQQDSGLGTAAGSLVDYGGISLNDAARLYALAWPASRQTVKQQQCMGYVPPYFWYAPGNYRIWEEIDPFTQRLVAYKFYGQIAQGERTVYMDGRPRQPAYAPHTLTGFSTGKYDADILAVTTSHMKRGWIRANGVPQSDEATLTEHYIRHEDIITVFAVTDDPVYLSEPFSKTSIMLRQTKDPDGWLYACDDSEQILGRKSDYVPSHFFGQNPSLREYADKNKVPLLGALGGAETMYPDFPARVKDAEAAETAAKAKLLPCGSQQASHAKDPTPNDGEIHTLHVAGNVYMLTGDGANIAVQVGRQGAFVVDTGAGRLSEK